MKLFLIQIFFFVRNRKARKNISLLIKFLAFLATIVTIYSAFFHSLMLSEGRNSSLITCLWRILTDISILSFGNITFSTDIGLLFTLLILLSGIILLLIMPPSPLFSFFMPPLAGSTKPIPYTRTACQKRRETTLYSQVLILSLKTWSKD